jgi:CubicO group peptidase (beta-lactamase class C family)
MRLRRVLGALLAIFVAFAWPAAAHDLKTRVDRQIDRALAEHRIVGTVIVIAHDGKIVFHRAAGFADRESNQPAAENTLFRLASMSKPVVSAAAMALVERGQMKLDDPVTRWLPEFRPKTANGEAPDISIGQLLTHTAGLSYGFLQPADGSYRKANVSDGLDQPGLAMDQELQRIATAGLAFEPGTKWAYSVAIDVLGAAIAKCAGVSLPEALRQLITGPLGAGDIGFTVSDRQRLAVPYVDGKPAPTRMADDQLVPFASLAGVHFTPSRVFDPASYPSGGAGLVGTADDYLRFLEAIRTGSTILKPATTAMMLGDQIGTKGLQSRPGWGFGLGAAVLADPAVAKTPQSAGTWAWSGIYGTTFFVDPGRKLSVVALTNTAFEGLRGAFPTDIRDAIYSQH